MHEIDELRHINPEVIQVRIFLNSTMNLIQIKSVTLS